METRCVRVKIVLKNGQWNFRPLLYRFERFKSFGPKMCGERHKIAYFARFAGNPKALQK